MNSYKAEGIILKRNNFGEADKILTFFTKHHGKISLIAKGIRRTTSRKGGHLELFNQVKVFVAKGRNLDVVTEAEVINAFKDWRRDLKKVAVAYQLCELVDKLTAELVENQEVYDLLLNSFTNLLPVANHQSLIANFELSLLQSLGFWPRGKAVGDLDLEGYIENLINRRLRAKDFLKRV